MTEFNIPDFIPDLKKGVGSNPEAGGCLVQVAGYLYDGKSWTDGTPCIASTVRMYAIAANDNATTQEQRNSLLKYIPRMLRTGELNTVTMGGLKDKFMSYHDSVTMNVAVGQDPGVLAANRMATAFTVAAREAWYSDSSRALANQAHFHAAVARLEAALGAAELMLGITAEPIDPIPASKWADLKEAMNV